MNEMNLINITLTDKMLYENIKKYGLKYKLHSLYIYEELEPILYMLKKSKDNITLITRLKSFFEKLSELDDELEINYYVNIFNNLQKIQIKNCKQEDKWYFKNLGLL